MSGTHPVTRRIAPIAQARARLRTLRDLIRYAVSRFEAAQLAYGHGTQNAWDEAVWLMLWVLHLPPDQLEHYLDAALTDDELDTALELIERRCTERVPGAYLTGEAWLRGHRFLADPRALVPRSLIAEAIEESISPWLSGEPDSILDLCTGGASLAILAAYRWPQAQITASDLSAQALSLARENLRLHDLAERIEVVQGDLFEALADRRFDLILCNPPYVNAASMQALPPEFGCEPRGALAAGVDGMDLVREIVAHVPDHLTEEGGLLLEIGHERAHFEAAFERLEFAWVPVAAGDDQLVWIERESLLALR
jgi:ribosomal protein L3 glutamine methyltransferase